MPRADVIVLGAGIVGISAALHLAKRGLSVVLVDRRGPGEETSYGNAGVIEGNTLFPHAFPAASARCCGSRSSRRRRRTITVVPAAGRAMAVRLSAPTRRPSAARSSPRRCGRCSRVR